MNNKKEINPLKSAELFANAFVNTNTLSNEAFIKRAFNAVFEMIPEAEKGTYFELSGHHFYAILSKGYDLNILSKLCFHKDDAFTNYENSDDQTIDAYEVTITKRDDENLSVEMIDILKQLGTYGGFISLFAPIKFESEKIGIMCFDNFSQQHFSEISKTFLRIYAQLLSNFYSMKLYQEKSENRYQNIISALVTAIEIKDSYTKGHASRVMEISESIAKSLGFSERRIDDLKNAAILHDVGKIGIPTEILNKNGPLTDEEYEIIKEHPEKAKHILEKIEDFEEITELAYCHHEHFNGGGYPRGIKGSETPLDAQIIQLADAFDAMTSERAYRKAYSIEKALKIINEEKGQQFHPELVDILTKIYNQKRP